MDNRDELLLAAVEALLVPLARLCVAHGWPSPPVEELLKRAFVRAAREAKREQGAAMGRDVSQISVATGLARREVARLSESMSPMRVERPSPAGRMYAHWMTSPDHAGPDGLPQPLRRSGPPPSFDALAQSITRNVHPRSVLDEMQRLGLARLSEDGQTVFFEPDRTAPTQDDAQMFGFLGANVGDHLTAAVENVIHRDRRHFEQAIYADELSEASAVAIGELARRQWDRMRAELIPELESLIAVDQAHGRRGDHRVRLGMFSFNEPDPNFKEPPDEEPSAS